MADHNEYKKILDKIDNLNKKKVLSVGCGSGYFEHRILKNGLIQSIDCINKPMEYGFPFDHSLEKLKNFNYSDTDFITDSFKKKYDVLLFINSIQFILGSDPKKVDPEYLYYIKNKILDLLKDDGYILVVVTNKKWFQKYKPGADPIFLQYLSNSVKNILNILKHDTKVISKLVLEYKTIILFKLT